MEEPEYEQRLNDMFCEAFETNHPAMHDWVLIKMELRSLRNDAKKEETGENPCDRCHWLDEVAETESPCSHCTHNNVLTEAKED